MGPGDEVPERMADVQAGGIDGDGRLLGDQAGVGCGCDRAFEEAEKGPPLGAGPRRNIRVE